MSQAKNLPADSTIKTVLGSLEKPETYVCTVLENIHACRKAAGTDHVQVRIGIMGTGKLPNHRIDFVDADGAKQCFGAFDGKHPFKDVDIQEATWSNASMTYGEVRQMLGDMRGFKLAKPLNK